MLISPFYDEIKSNAVKMLENPAGFNGYSQQEIKALDRWELQNSVGVALIKARDDVFRRERIVLRKLFNKGNHAKAEAEILRTFSKRKKS